MLKQLTDKELCKLFDKLAVHYRLLVPGELDGRYPQPDSMGR